MLKLLAINHNNSDIASFFIPLMLTLKSNINFFFPTHNPLMPSSQKWDDGY